MKGWETTNTQKRLQIHIISFEPISKGSASKSFDEPSVKFVITDVIGRLHLVGQDPVGRSINSDWFVKSFIIVAYENFIISIRIQCPMDNDWKFFSHRQIS